MSSRSLLLSSCSPSERMMKREFHLYLYNIDGGRTEVSHRTRRREGNGGQRRKRRTSSAPRLPCARGGGRVPSGPAVPAKGRGGEGSGVPTRRRQGHLWRRYDASLCLCLSRGSGGPRCCACARAKPTRPWKKRKPRFRQCLAEVRGACFSPWCVLQEVG